MIAIIVFGLFWLLSGRPKRMPMYKIKEGADIRHLRPEISSRIPQIDGVISYTMGPDVLWWITAGRDGQHMQGSKHYKDLAIDVDVPIWTDRQRATIAADLSKALGPDFDIVDEGSHIHIEFDT